MVAARRPVAAQLMSTAGCPCLTVNHPRWPCVRHGAAVCPSRSPARVGWLAPLDVVVVVAVLDDLALVVEVQHRHSRVGEFLALFGPAGPPFDRGPATGDDRLAEPALDVLLGRELLAEIAAYASQAQVRLAERGRAVNHRVGIQGDDCLGVAPGPGPRPGVRPAPGGGLSIHPSDSNTSPPSSAYRTTFRSVDASRAFGTAHTDLPQVHGPLRRSEQGRRCRKLADGDVWVERDRNG